MPGWIDKKDKWVRVFDAKTDAETTATNWAPATTTTLFRELERLQGRRRLGRPQGRANGYASRPAT